MVGNWGFVQTIIHFLRNDDDTSFHLKCRHNVKKKERNHGNAHWVFELD